MHARILADADTRLAETLILTGPALFAAVQTASLALPLPALVVVAVLVLTTFPRPNPGTPALRVSADKVGLACGALLPVALLPALPPAFVPFALAASVSTLVPAAVSSASWQTAWVSSGICALLTVPLSDLRVSLRVGAAFSPVLFQALLQACEVCFTFAECALVSAAMAAVSWRAVCAAAFAAAGGEQSGGLIGGGGVRGVTFSALTGAVLLCFVGIRDALRLPKAGMMRRCSVVACGVIAPTYFFAWGCGLGQEPVLWTIRYVTESRTRLLLSAYWATLLYISVVLYPPHTLGLQRNLARKVYHVLALALFAPGIYLDAGFTSFGLSVALCLLLAAETLRPVLPALSTLTTLLDTRDSGAIPLTHIYLLLGCAGPLWLTQAHSVAETAQNALLRTGGLTTLCVLDAVAAAVGQTFGTVNWPGTRRTLEGTTAGIAAGVLFAAGARAGTLSTVAPVVIAGALEAVTAQIDNLVLPVAFVAMAALCR